MKSHTKILVLLLALFMVHILGINQASALTYQDELDVSFTFNSSISMSLSSSDLVISSLSPNTYADSNIVTITTSTNDANGYTLIATAGDGDTYTNTNLIDSSNNFTSLGTSDSIGSMSSANVSQNSRWGYSFSTDSGTTWRNATGGTGYSGLPYYTATGAQIAKTNSNGTSSVQFKIGAKANAAQSAGIYKNVINFVATANPPVTRHYTVNYIDTSGEAWGMPEQQTGILENNYIDLSWDEPSSNDYSFDGWCAESGYASDDCYGDARYHPGDRVYVNEESGDVVINLYSIWYPAQVYFDGVYIDNQSDAEVFVDVNSDTRSVEPWYDDYFDYFSDYIEGQYPVTISVPEGPSACPSNWIWNATVNDEYGGTEYHNGMTTSDSIYLGDYGGMYSVNITGSCGN